MCHTIKLQFRDQEQGGCHVEEDFDIRVRDDEHDGEDCQRRAGRPVQAAREDDRAPVREVLGHRSRRADLETD